MTTAVAQVSASRDNMVISSSSSSTASPSSSSASPNNDFQSMSNDASSSDPMEPRDNDVICGRGGAALNHPGNQKYRRLVNLNKSVYITCLKNEKLKLSKSIVEAIREQHGRFLERDAKTGAWYDIGDKKAISKTSQALREGQPKLRETIVQKKMAEMGQGEGDDDQY